jgi:hypothetical protein
MLFIVFQSQAPSLPAGLEGVESITFKSKVYQIGPVRLTQGEFRASAVPNAVSEIVVKLTDKRGFGVVNGKMVGALVATTTLGGSGTFYELALLIEGVESVQGWTNTDTVLLGDRIRVHSLAIERDHITIVMTMHRPQDAMCCPTLTVIKCFAVGGDQFVMVSEEAY